MPYQDFNPEQRFQHIQTIYASLTVPLQSDLDHQKARYDANIGLRQGIFALVQGGILPIPPEDQPDLPDNHTHPGTIKLPWQYTQAVIDIHNRICLLHLTLSYVKGERCYIDSIFQELLSAANPSHRHMTEVPIDHRIISEKLAYDPTLPHSIQIGSLFATGAMKAQEKILDSILDPAITQPESYSYDPHHNLETWLFTTRVAGLRYQERRPRRGLSDRSFLLI